MTPRRIDGHCGWLADSRRATRPNDSGDRTPELRVEGGRAAGSLGSLGRVTLPGPDERVGQRLFEDLAIAVPRCPAEYVTVVVAFCLEGRGGPLVGHHPIVKDHGTVTILKVCLIVADESDHRFDCRPATDTRQHAPTRSSTAIPARSPWLSRTRGMNSVFFPGWSNIGRRCMC